MIRTFIVAIIVITICSGGCGTTEHAPSDVERSGKQGGQHVPVLAPPPHPRIFLSAETLPKLKEKIVHPEMRERYRRMLARCDRWLKMEPVKPPDVPSNAKSRAGGELWRSRMAQGRAVTLSLAWLLSGENKYADRAKTELWCFTDVWKSWVDPFHGDADYYDLMSGEMSFTAGIVYDWLYDSFTPEERDKLRNAMISRTMTQYLRYSDVEKNPKEVAYWFKSHANWNAVCNGGAILSALALEGEYPEAGEILRRARGSIKGYFDAFPSDGACIEGTGYWQYGMRYGAMAMEALRFAGGGDDGVFDRPSMKQTAYFPLYCCPRGIPVSFGDAGSPVTDSVLNLFADRYQNKDFAWYADAHCQDKNVETEGFPKEAFEILWRPVGDGWSADGVKGSSMETARVFDAIGWSIFVDRWPAPDVVAGFKCGDLGASHTQLDNNTFQIWAYGKWLAVDPGSGSYNAEYFGKKRWQFYEVTTEGHNGVLIDGKGQKPKTKGHLGKLRQGGNVVTISGDATANYGDKNVLSAVRHFAMIDRKAFLVVDVVRTKNPSVIETRLHTWAKAEAMADRVRVRNENIFFDVSTWSNVPIDTVVQEDPGKTRTSMPLKPEWVISTTSREAVTEVVIASLLHPFPEGKQEQLPAIKVEEKEGSLTFETGIRDIRLSLTKDTMDLSITGR